MPKNLGTPREVFNVRAYGAVGDGATNDRAAIQAVIDAIPAQGGEVYFPAGQYLVNSPLNVQSKSYITFRGENTGTRSIVYDGTDTGGRGACIKTNSNIEVFKIENTSASWAMRCAGIVFENLQIRGNGRASTSVGIRTASSDANYASTDNLILSHCTIINHGTGLKLEYDDAPQIHHCWVSENGNALYYGRPGGATLGTAVHGKIDACGFWDNDGYGVQLECVSYVSLRSSHFGNNDGPNVQVIGTVPSKAVAIVGNTLYAIQTLSADNITAIVTNSRIADNIVEMPASSTGVGIATAINTAAQALTGNAIQNNLVTGGRYGIFLYSSSLARYSAILVSGNVIRSSRRHGLYAWYLDDSSIHGNVFFGNCTETDATYDQIHLDLDCNRNSIQNNTIRRGPSGNRARYGVRIDQSDCDDNYVTNNDLKDSGSTGTLNDNGTGTITTAGNRT